MTKTKLYFYDGSDQYASYEHTSSFGNISETISNVISIAISDLYSQFVYRMSNEYWASLFIENYGQIRIKYENGKNYVWDLERFPNTNSYIHWVEIEK
jgi:hypothetical protein